MSMTNDYESFETQVASLTAGQWTQVSTTNTFADVAVTREEHDTLVANGSEDFWGWGGSSIVFRSWTSSAYDVDGSRMFFMGGGRVNYGGNEVYELDFNALKWSRVTDPSPLTVKDYDDPSVDGSSKYDIYIPEDAPNTSHTYDGLTWNPATGSFWYTTTYVGFDDVNANLNARNPSRKAVWELDVETGEWTQHASTVNHKFGASTYLSVTEQILSFHNAGANDVFAYLYDEEGTERFLGEVNHPDGTSLNAANVAFNNTETGEVFVVSKNGEGIQRIDIDQSAQSIQAIKVTDLPSTTELGVDFDFASAGFAYRPVDDKFYIWNGGSRVVTWDPATNDFEAIWNEDSTQAPPADGLANDKNFEKWQYVEAHDAFVGVMMGDVFTWKPGGNPADINQLEIGDVSLDFNTTGSLGVFVPVLGGDKDHDGAVTLSYREAGTGDWQPAMDLMRLRPELNQADQESPPGFAGSIFGLDPDTDYEVKVEVSDPDGVQGSQVQTLSAATKAVPARDPASATVIDVYDAVGLQAALDNAQPGHVIQVNPGTYTLSDELRLDASGTADNPIVIRGLDRSSTIIDAQDDRGFFIKGDHVTVEDLSITNTSEGIAFRDADGITIRGNYIQVNDTDDRGQKGINGSGDDTYIADNILEGPFNFGQIDTGGSDRGINVGGHNVEIAYNTLSGFLDAIAGANDKSVGVEIHHNEVLWSTDNGIELDHGLRNISAHHNRLSNTTDAMSAQTVAGGPAYVFDNILLNVGNSPLKVKPLGKEESQGIYFVNNTIVKEGLAWGNDSGRPSQMTVLNNLFLGQGNNDKGDTLRNLSDHRLTELDYNAWLTDGRFRIDLADENDIAVGSFADFQANTQFAEHSLLLAGEQVFENYTLDFDQNGFLTFRDPEGTDFTLDASSSAVDAAVLLANINDGFTGAAPDIGAVETGDGPVQYGARITLAPATAPIAAADAVFTQVDAPVTFDPAANDWDPNGDALQVTAITQPAAGSAVLNADGTVTFTPPVGYTGDVGFGYTLSDANGEQVTGSIGVTVTAPNDAPSTGDDSAKAEQDTSLQIAASDLLSNDSDPNGDQLTVTGVAAGANGSVSLAGDTVTYTPNGGFLGTDSFTYTVSDGRGGTATGTVAVEVLSDGIVLGTDGNDRFDLSTAGTGQVLDALSGTDRVVGSAYADEIAGGAGDDELAGGGGDDTFIVAGASGLDEIAGGAGTDRIVGSAGDDVIGLAEISGVEAIDGGAGTDVLRGTDNGREQWDFSSVTLNGIELIDAGGHNNLVRGSQAADRIASYGDKDELYGEGGDDVFLYAGTSDDVDEIDGGAGNDLIQGSDGDDQITLKSFTGIERIDGGAGQDVISGTDNGREVWDFTGVTVTGVDMIDPGGHHDVVTGSDGDDAFRAGAGDDSFDGAGGSDVIYFTGKFADYRLSDQGGSLLVQALASDEGDDRLTNMDALQFADGVYRDGAFHPGEVVAYDPAPSEPATPVASDDSLTVAEDGSVAFDPTANDSLTETTTLAGITAPQHGAVTQDETGQLVYTPDADYAGADSFAYTLSDANGNESTATVTIDVTGVNDTPTARNDTARTQADTAVTIDVLANDSDPDGGSLALDQLTPPANGTVVVNADGSVTYTPEVDASGVQSFTYTLSDGQGGSDTARVSVDVEPVPPVADPDNVQLSEDGSVTFNPLANDLLTGTSTLDRVTSPAHGSVVVGNDGRLTYTPDPDFSGADSFDYTLRDADGNESTATVALEVAAVNDAPVASDDTAATEAETAVTLDVLANDSDVDGGRLSVAAVDQPDHGTVALNGDGTLTYKPYAGVSGVQSLGYTVRDGQGGTAMATVAVEVAPPVTMDEVAGTAGNDSIDAGAADGGQAIFAGGGDDFVVGSDFGDLIDGGAGRDELVGGAGDDSFLLAGDSGIDHLIAGGAGRDEILGSGGDDLIGVRSIAGIEAIDGGAGRDVIRGSDAGREEWDFSTTELSGVELIDAGGHNDLVRGSQGDDRIASNGGNNELYGEAGDDVFVYDGAKSEADEISGGDGFDRIEGGAGNDDITLDTLDSIELIDGGSGLDAIRGTDKGREVWDFTGVELVDVELIDAGGHHDKVTGSAGNDHIRGGDGRDRIDGGDGYDVAYFDLAFADYEITGNGGDFTVTAQAGGEERDRLSDVEALRFADGVYEKGNFTLVGINDDSEQLVYDVA